MARKLSQSDPVLSIDFFTSGFYTYRSQLFAPFKGIGVNVISFHDPVIDGNNMELLDILEWQRRPGFSIFCATPLPDGEIVNQFYSSRILNGTVIPFADTTSRLVTFSPTAITPILSKTTNAQGFISTIGNMTYFSDGASADLYAWDATNLSTWGLAAPSEAPLVSGLGFWQQYVIFSVGTSILDTNGCIETGTNITIPTNPISGKNEPSWNTNIGGLTADGGLVWTNNGPILTWAPATNYPTPVVVLDPNGFLQLGSTLGSSVAAYDASIAYSLGDVVTFGGAYWVKLTTTAPTTGVTPSAVYTTSSTTGGVTTTLAYWAQTSNPLVTGNLAPVWNTTVGGTTSDGSYVWTNIGQGTGIAFTGYAYVFAYRTVYGHLTTASAFSANTGAILGPINGAITRFSITSNIVTFQGTNNFLPGNVFEVAGLTSPIGVQLNGQALTVISAIPSESFPLTSVATDIAGTTLTILAINNLAFGGGQQVTFSGVGTAFWLNGVTATVLAATGTQFTATIPAGHPSYGPTGDIGLVNVNGSYTAAFAYVGGPTGDIVDSGEALPLIASLSGPACASPLCNSVVNITAVKVVSNVVTLTALNNFQPGLWVTITGLTNAGFIDGQQLQVIAVDQPVGTQNTWFQVYFVNPNYPLTADTGAATFNAVEIYRTSDGGGTYLFDGAVTNPTVVPLAPFDSGLLLAGAGADALVTPVVGWIDPNNVTSASVYATNSFSPPLGGSGAFSVVQSATGQGHYGYNVSHDTYSNGPANIVVSLPNPVTAGNTLLCIVVSDGQTINLISDNQTNGYGLVTSAVMASLQGTCNLDFYIVETPTAAATTVTVNVTPNPSEVVMVLFLEVQGIVTPLSVDVFTSATGSGATFNTGNVTTINDPDILISCIYQENIGAIQPAADTLLASQTVTAKDGEQFQLSAAWQSVTTPTTYSSVWTGTTFNQAWGVTVALKSLAVAASDGLNATTFPISVPVGVAIQGIEITFDAKYDGNAADAFISVQLLKNGNPWGNPKQITGTDGLTSTVVTFTLGSTTDLWGGVWTASDFTPTTLWGVRFTAVQYAQTPSIPYTFSIRNVNAEVYGESGLNTWVFNDFVPDANLDELLIAPLYHQNDPPPGGPGSVSLTTGTILAYWQGRLWQVVGNYVYFDAGPDCTNGIPEQAWPPGYRFQFAGPVLGLQPTADGVGLLVYLADRVNVILGGPETISFYASDALSNFGISNPNAIFRDGSIIGQFTTQKQYFELIDKQKQEIGEHIADYLAANFTAAQSYVTMHRDGLDVGVFISNGVDRVLRYGSNISAWSVPAFPLYGAGALASIETSVGITTLMLASPAGKAPAGKNYIFARDVNSWGDAGGWGLNNGTPYAVCNVVIGSITLSQLGAHLLALQHVVGYFNAAGTLNNGGPSYPDIWILPNEIAATTPVPFVYLPEVLQEPPTGQNNPSSSLLALRWPVNMVNSTQMSQFIHHMQIKIQFEPENAPNTLKAIAFKEEQD